MIKPFEFYKKKNFVRKGIPNPDIAGSLLEKAELRLERIKNEKVEEKMSSMVFEDVYELIREASQSLMELNGFKPYSHEALISFLIEYKMLSIDKINILDNYRVLRNNSVYKAEKISIDKCKESLTFAIKILPEIREKFSEIKKEEK